MRAGVIRAGGLSGLLLLLAGCAGEQSIFSSAGEEAERTLLLTWILSIGSLVIFLIVLAALALALWGRAEHRRWLSSQNTVVRGGIIFPVVVLSALLIYGFAALNSGSPAPGEDAVRIRVDGLQWWWRVTYLDANGEPIETANEIHIPVGRTVELELRATDVIHSFWVPAYAGKVDMIPGRDNSLTLLAREPGVTRGQCAEYCGGAHALMAFGVVAMEPDAFDAWLAAEAEPANITDEAGAEAFLRTGCGACHTVRGTPARGTAGPDLTHVASRLTIGAGILPTSRDAFLDWLKRHKQIKPENHMPAFDTLAENDREAIAGFLAGLE